MTHSTAADSLVRVTDDRRGADVRARREHLGMSKAALAKMAGVDRGKLQRFEEGEDQPSDRWVGSVLRALEQFEGETGHTADDAARAADAGFIRFRVEGVHGAQALIVEGPVANLPELEAAVDRIMRRLAADQGDV